MSYSRRLNSIISTLNARGLEKVASEVSEVKEAMFGEMPDYNRGTMRPPLHGEKNRGQFIPTDRNTPVAKKGEPVIELDPTTGEEKIILWGIDRPLSQKEIMQDIKSGAMTEERLKSEYSKGGPKEKKFLAPLIEEAQGPQAYVPYHLGKKFAYISDQLKKRGYTILVDKFDRAISDYKKYAAESKEDHNIPSVEKVYEESETPEEFGKKIKKLIGVHDKIISLVKKFDEKLDSEVKKSKKLSESDAVKKIVYLVTDTDKKTESEIDKIS
jgi:hypothetical protein